MPRKWQSVGTTCLSLLASMNKLESYVYFVHVGKMGPPDPYGAV
jgi:hypothetical protein